MLVTPIALVELETDASIVEACAKRVHLAVLKGSAVIVAWFGCLYLKRARWKANKLRRNLSALDQLTDEQRGIVKEVAVRLGKSVTDLDDAILDCERRGLDRLPIVGPMMVSELSALAELFEDVAETAALASSSSFAKLARAEVTRNLEEHNHATA